MPSTLSLPKSTVLDDVACDLRTNMAIKQDMVANLRRQEFLSWASSPHTFSTQDGRDY